MSNIREAQQGGWNLRQNANRRQQDFRLESQAGHVGTQAVVLSEVGATEGYERGRDRAPSILCYTVVPSW